MARVKPLDRAQARAELATRFFESHGPATVKDLAWWSGLTMAESRAGLEAVRSALEREVVDGQDLWHAPGGRTADRDSRKAHLIPAYDETLIAYRDSRAFFKPYARQLTRDHGQILVLSGRALGSWRRVMSGPTLVVENTPFDVLTAAERRGVEDAVKRYARFHGLDAMVEYRAG